MGKKVYSFYLEEGAPELLLELGLNRSELISDLMISVLTTELKMNPRATNSRSLQEKICVFLSNCHLQEEARELVHEKVEQNAYARMREQQETEQINKRLLTEYEKFCLAKGFPPRRFADFLLGEDANYDFNYLEELSQYFEKNNLPRDLNKLRPLLMVRR